MKILITTDLFTTETNGVVTSVKNLREELEKKGHEVRILTLSQNRKSYKEKDDVYIKSISLNFIYPDIRMPISYRNKMIRDIIEWRPDVIHSQCEFFSMQFAKRISKITGAPIVHTYHTLYEQYVGYAVPGKRFGKWLVRFLMLKRLKKVNLVVAPTLKVEEVLKKYGLNKPIEVVPSGICLDRYKERLSEIDKAEKRKSWGIREDQVVLINLGRLGTEKNTEELIEFFSKAVEKDEKLVFLIVGDGPAREDLEKLSNKLGIDNNVIFTGMVEPLEVQNYYQLGDVFISASTSETQGLTYVEAAASGLPLLCRKDLCLEGIIIQGENGYQYEEESEFLEYVNAIANNMEWRDNASKISEDISSLYDKSTFGDKIESIYKLVV